MPFDISLAIKLGRFVQDAYTMNTLPDPTKIQLWDPSFRIVNFIYGDDEWDQKDGYVAFGFIACSPAAPYTLAVIVRGTENIWDWMADAIFLRQKCSIAGAPGGAETEGGFASLYNTLRVGPTSSAVTLKAAVQACLGSLGAANVAQVCVSGHSLGGALATLIAADLVGSQVVELPHVYTFASPAVGEKTFGAWYDGLAPDSYRIFNSPDIVPTLPPSIFGYTHTDEPYQINSGATTQSSVGCHHSLGTYLHALDPTQVLDPACAILGLPAASAAPLPGT
jgi:hypothetical protein